MPRFRVTVSYTEIGHFVVEAINKTDAKFVVDTLGLPKDGEYLEDSMEFDSVRELDVNGIEIYEKENENEES
jgi:hypothetical protein